jgi:GTP:adenosylcobinamide-phosphate guanylyltransferase/tRNA A-37 threonylcarbamoyl transferase component Bud32
MSKYWGSSLNIEYIIVQAGGKGSRLGYLTANKPKTLVPIQNLPMLFHLFNKYPDKKFVVIADYKEEVLREYLECFAKVKYQVVNASASGTCGGINQAIDLLPENTPFMIIWSDLILSDSFALPKETANYIGISQTFPCRWKYKNDEFLEEASVKHGVAGLFIFQDKSSLNQLPESGELVKWMKEQKLRFKKIELIGTREIGILSEYEALGQEKCRPFNKISVDGNILTKEPIDEQGEKLSQLEQDWYAKAKEIGVKNIPTIYGTSPLKMEYINGKNIYEYTSLNLDDKTKILQKLVDSLKNLHSLVTVTADTFSLKDAYYTKTIARLQKIRDLVPFADLKTITVNGRKCPNIYYYKRDLEKMLDKLPCKYFTFIHGDCTFSNLMIKDDSEPIFIDPRGYFGHTRLYGDPNYDWAKLYYSLVGNYDRFNLKDFRLTIKEGSVDLIIASNQWENMELDFFALSNADPNVIKLLHAVIWLSLTTYAWQDYDSICGAFYNGLYHLGGLM